LSKRGGTISLTYVISSTVATTPCHPMHIYVSALLDCYAIKLVLYFSSPTIRETLSYHVANGTHKRPQQPPARSFLFSEPSEALLSKLNNCLQPCNCLQFSTIVTIVYIRLQPLFNDHLSVLRLMYHSQAFWCVHYAKSILK
jgi:hypothetical protein